MKRLTLLATLLVTLALVPAASAPGKTGPASAQAVAAKCSTVSYGGRTFIMYHQGIGCTSARRKVRYVHRHKRLPGWTCESGTNFRTGGGCWRGRKVFGWHPGD
jgi:hypothetical protein